MYARLKYLLKFLLLLCQPRIRVWDAWLSWVDSTIGIFSAHYGTLFFAPKNRGVHPNIPSPVPTAAALIIIVWDHKNDLRVFNEYHALEKACKKVIQELIPENFYKLLTSHLINFTKVTCLTILTHLSTEYAKLDDDVIQKINKNTKKPITGETLFEECVEQIEWNQEAVSVHNPYTLKQIVSMVIDNIKKSCLYTEDCHDWGHKRLGDKTRANFKPTLLVCLKKYVSQHKQPKEMVLQQTWIKQIQIQKCLPKCNKITQKLLLTLPLLQDPIEKLLVFSRK